jgi:hypothetical protein
MLYNPHSLPAGAKRRGKLPKLTWYRKPSFAAHGRMSRTELRTMDAAYRMQFGPDAGGQRQERKGTYKRDFVIAEHNVRS